MFFFFFFNDTATTEIYTLSLHDALPIFDEVGLLIVDHAQHVPGGRLPRGHRYRVAQVTLGTRSEEHTSELQSRLHLVCRLLLEKKKKLTTSRHRCTTCSSSANAASRRAI